MTIGNAQRAEVLVHALPYIQKYNGQVVVVKYGGNAMLDDELRRCVMKDIALLGLIGVKIVLVHGGGPEITDMLGKIGKESVFCDGLRVTDEETVDVAQMVLAGKVNKDLVALLQSTGARTVGLSGIDGGMIKASQLDPRLGYVGRIDAVDAGPVISLLDAGYIPIVSSLGCDDEGNTYNINADSAAAALAGALGARALLLMTNTSGVLADAKDPDSLITRMTIAEVAKAREDGIIAGGMIPKVQCCVDALEAGVHRVFIIDGTVPHSLLIEMLTDEGIGTLFVKE